MDIALARPSAERFYALDWLRSCAFILLLWIHTALLFTDYGWHLHLHPLPFVAELIQFCRPWRMPLIFLVSGTALSFSLDRRGALGFVRQTAARILYPLIFGLFVLIPPALYFERIDEGNPVSLAGAYLGHVQNLIRGDFDWLHLWYLGYLLAFCVAGGILWPLVGGLFRSLRSWRWPSGGRGFAIALAMAMPLIVAEVLLRPHFPIQRNFYSDIASVAVFLTVFIYGTTLCRNPDFLSLLVRCRWLSLALGVGSSYLLLAELEPGALRRALEGLNLWLWLMFFVGFAGAYFNRPMPWVKAFNSIVFPFYLIHQVAILTVAYILRDYIDGWLLYFAIVAGSAILCYLLIHFVILKLPVLYRVFGVSR